MPNACTNWQSKPWQMSKLMNRYYLKTGMANTGNGSCPKFVEFRAGYGLVDETCPGKPKLLHIPPNMIEVPGEFYRGLVNSTCSNGIVTFECEIPQGAVSEPARHNMIGIFDQDSELVAVCTTLPGWFTPTEIYRAFPALTFPIELDGDTQPDNGNDGCCHACPHDHGQHHGHDHEHLEQPALTGEVRP